MNTDAPVELVTTMDEGSKLDFDYSEDYSEDNMDGELLISTMDEGSKLDFDYSEDYPSEDYSDYNMDRERLYYMSEQATCLLELSSIFIRWDTYREFLHAQLVGCVSLTDDCGETITLLDQGCSNDAFCPHGNSLEIKLGASKKFRPLLVPKQFVLKLILEDRSRETVIVEEELVWDLSNELVYDELHWRRFNIAGDGFVSLGYTIFRNALLAFVNTKVIKMEQEDDLDATVSGTVTASIQLWNGSIRRVLFDKLQSDKIMLPSAGLCLSSCFPVPAYSSLKIHAKLKINNEIIGTGEDGLEVEVSDNTYSPYKKKIKGGKAHVIVKVRMSYAGCEFPKQLLAYDKNPIADEGRRCSSAENTSMSSEESDELLEWNENDNRFLGYHHVSSGDGGLELYSGFAECENISKSEDIPENEEIQFGHQDKRIRVHRVIPMSQAMPKIRIARFSFPTYNLLPLVELFSITACPYVNTDDRHHMRLCGTIQIQDDMDEFVIFEGVENKPTLLLPCEKIPLAGSSRCYMGTRFTVRLNLKNDKDEISNGVMDWDFHNVDGWFDRRISSVVQGKNGFATIHHIMFSGAVQAEVKVSIRDKDACVFEVNGKILASYHSRRYSTLYDNEYFKSLLFQQKTDFLQIPAGEDVPLLKPVVPVPVDDVLVVQLKLYRWVAGKKESLKGNAHFSPRGSKEPLHIIQGTSCEVNVSVQWYG